MPEHHQSSDDPSSKIIPMRKLEREKTNPVLKDVEPGSDADTPDDSGDASGIRGPADPKASE